MRWSMPIASASAVVRFGAARATVEPRHSAGGPGRGSEDRLCGLRDVDLEAVPRRDDLDAVSPYTANRASRGGRPIFCREPSEVRIRRGAADRERRRTSRGRTMSRARRRSASGSSGPAAFTMTGAESAGRALSAAGTAQRGDLRRATATGSAVVSERRSSWPERADDGSGGRLAIEPSPGRSGTIRIGKPLRRARHCVAFGRRPPRSGPARTRAQRSTLRAAGAPRRRTHALGDDGTREAGRTRHPRSRRGDSRAPVRLDGQLVRGERVRLRPRDEAPPAVRSRREPTVEACDRLRLVSPPTSTPPTRSRRPARCSGPRRRDRRPEPAQRHHRHRGLRAQAPRAHAFGAAPRGEEGRFGVHGSANSSRGRAPVSVKIWRCELALIRSPSVNSCADFRTRIGSGWWDGVPRKNGALRKRTARSRPRRTARPR